MRIAIQLGAKLIFSYMLGRSAKRIVNALNRGVE